MNTIKKSIVALFWGPPQERLMDKITRLILAILSLALIVWMSTILDFYFLIGLMICVAIAGGLFLMIRKYNERRILRILSKQIDNVYVYSEYPDDPTVRKRAEELRRLLALSGNETGARVIEIYYRDAEGELNDPCESWEEYLIRREEVTRMYSAVRMREFNSYNREKFLTHQLNQQ